MTGSQYYSEGKFYVLIRCIKLNIYIIFSIVSSSYAEIIVDKNAPKNQQPGISLYTEESKSCKELNAYCRGANYTAVNIQTPNEQGVSINKYTKFDVVKGNGNDMVSLNNFTADYSTGNPNLTTNAAKVILNEVTSGSESILDSILVVAGEKAHVIIANPAGINCDGCRFNNTDHVTLTTGIPVFMMDTLSGYHIYGGTINIGNNGLQYDEDNNANLDIFTHKLNVNGIIKANDMLSISGKYAVNYTADRENINIYSLTAFSPADKKDTGVDVSHLGGMYANKIFIFSGKSGINNAGVIQADDVVSLISNSFIKNNNGKIYSERVNLHTSGEIDNQQGEIKNRKQSLAVGLHENSGVTIYGKKINNKEGYIHSNIGNVNIEAIDEFYNEEGLIRTVGSYGRADIKIKAKTVDNINGKLITSNNISIKSSHLKNSGGRVVSAFGQVDLSYQFITDTTEDIQGGMGVNRVVKP